MTPDPATRAREIVKAWKEYDYEGGLKVYDREFAALEDRIAAALTEPPPGRAADAANRELNEALDRTDWWRERWRNQATRAVKLMEALRKYGRHFETCPGDHPAYCECGFTVILKGAAAPAAPEDDAGRDEQPIIACPECGAEREDFDGFGVLHCAACGYCTHASVHGGVCGLCGKAANA